MLELNGPHGETIVSPTRDDIKRILARGAEYWSEAGDAALTYGGCDSLIFWKDEPYGVFILRLADYYAPCRADAEPAVVYHSVGGEPMAVPSCCYLTEAEAAEILFFYMDTGEVPASAHWRDIYEILGE